MYIYREREIDWILDTNFMKQPQQRWNSLNWTDYSMTSGISSRASRGSLPKKMIAAPDPTAGWLISWNIPMDGHISIK